jgi:MTH538 TIR-like domain (DUF1863)
MAHKVFISYHHDIDQNQRNKFEQLFADQKKILISKSVQIADLNPNLSDQAIAEKIRDEYLSDSTVTSVLIGTNTWGRKHVNWEIDSSLRNTKNGSRSGLLGILLPTHPDFGGKTFNPNRVPRKLVDNVDCNFAQIFSYSENANLVSKWIENAFERRNSITHDLSSPRLYENLN